MPTLTATLPTGATISRTTTHAYRFVIAGLSRISGQWEAILWTTKDALKTEAEAADAREWRQGNLYCPGSSPKGYASTQWFRIESKINGPEWARRMTDAHAARPTHYTEVVILPVSV